MLEKAGKIGDPSRIVVVGAGAGLGRYGMPEDIAGVMLFLCSRAGSWVNGAVLEVTGGSHLVGDRPASKSKL